MSKLNIVPLFQDIKLGDYEERRKFKIIWKPVLCTYPDLLYTLWSKFTKNNFIDPIIVENLNIPKSKGKNKYKIQIRLEFAGYVIINRNPDGVVD